jgi:hypothetical protein
VKYKVRELDTLLLSALRAGMLYKEDDEEGWAEDELDEKSSGAVNLVLSGKQVTERLVMCSS